VLSNVFGVPVTQPSTEMLFIWISIVVNDAGKVWLVLLAEFF